MATADADQFDGRIIAARAIDRAQKKLIAEAYDVLLDVRDYHTMPGSPLRDRISNIVANIENHKQNRSE